MDFIETTITDRIATVTINRGKVNALNLPLVEELLATLDELENSAGVRAIILTGAGKFFSFGFDVPEFISFDRDTFRVFLNAITALKLRLFLYSKPVIVAVNGHATGGGCMLVIPCDYRIMVTGRARIALNEINLAVPVFASSTAMLTACIGQQNAERFLYDGSLYTSQEACDLGLIDRLCPVENLTAEATAKAGELGAKDPAAFAGMKKLMRQPIADDVLRREEKSIEDFMNAWFSKAAQGILQGLKIHQ
jgi:enoyl-CoA hydratase/carnithine racemase